MANTVVTSKEEILKCARELVSENGLPALTMREVAARCNVALGSIYNYFPSKDDLTLSAIQSVWLDIFHGQNECEKTDMLSMVTDLFERIREGMLAYPNFFSAHSISFASSHKGRAKDAMLSIFHHMRQGLLDTLRSDPSVRADAFDDDFTPERLVDFIMSVLTTTPMRPDRDCGVLIEMIRRTVM